MARREEEPKSTIERRGRISRVRSAIARNARKLTSRLRSRSAEPERMEMASSEQVRTPAPHLSRPPHRQTDVELDLISNSYTPTQTSLKGSFRSTVTDRQRDQDFADGYSDPPWKVEDRFTNKSGDPRIGTHRRTYEPAEAGERKEER